MPLLPLELVCTRATLWLIQLEGRRNAWQAEGRRSWGGGVVFLRTELLCIPIPILMTTLESTASFHPILPRYTHQQVLYHRHCYAAVGAGRR